MTRSDTELEAEAYGFIARGYKILRKLALKRAGTPQEAGEISQEPSPEPEGEKPEGAEPLGFPLTPTQFLTEPRSKAYSVNYVGVLFGALLSGRVRASPSNYSLAWVADPSERRGWRSVSREWLTLLFDRVKEFHNHCVELLDSTYEKFCSDVGLLPITKFGRRRNIVQADVTFPCFVKWARAEHQRLPSVCGSQVAKKTRQE